MRWGLPSAKNTGTEVTAVINVAGCALRGISLH